MQRGLTLARKIKEWIAKHDDQTIPTSVKDRIFKRCNGLCHITGLPVKGQVYEFDHITPLADGGEHRESNIALALKKEHKTKTANENSQRAKEKRLRSKHLGYARKHQKPRITKRYHKETKQWRVFDTVKGEFL